METRMSVDLHQDCSLNHLNQCLALVPKEDDVLQSRQPGSPLVAVIGQFSNYADIVNTMAARLNALKQIQQAILQPE
jgi:hypothetical protein